MSISKVDGERLAAEADTSFLRNTWYGAAWAADIKPGSPTGVTLLNEPLVLFRTLDGELAALSGLCPHRFAPLSFGKIVDGELQCGYHGLRFNNHGHCVRNPHGAVPQRVRLRKYPVAERHDLVWIWMGEPQAADKSAIPDLSFIDAAPVTSRARGYCRTQADFRLFVDNVMDLSHVDYLHASAFGTDFLGRMAPEVHEEGNMVRARWWAQNKSPMPPYGQFLPDGAADNLVEVLWQPPGVMRLFTGAVSTGGEISKGVNNNTAHVMSPETEWSTHYFFCSVRNFALDDQQFTERLQQMLFNAFSNEDKPMIEAQQRAIGKRDLMKLQPALLASDSASVRVRRVLERIIRSELIA